LTNQLPAYLQQYQAPDIASALSQTLGAPMPPSVSIEGGRFTLVDAAGNEQPVATFDPKIGVYLDACIVDVNNTLSRIYYQQGYKNDGQGHRPDCFSDNGIGPSVHAGNPQAKTCTPDPEGVFGCKWAVWGSKISAVSGKGIPACSQKQKLALLIPGMSTLFLLAVPPNSFSFLQEYTELCKGHGMNIANLVTRISFVPGIQGTLQFHAASYIDEPTARLRQAAYTEKKTDGMLGRNDVARPTLPPPQGYGATSAAPAQQEPPIARLGAQPSLQHEQVQQPGPFLTQPAMPVGNQGAPNVANPSEQATQSASAGPAPTEPARRRRRTAAEMQAAQQPPAGQPANGAAPQAPFPHPGQQTPLADFGISQGQPAAANPELAGMLDEFFGKQG
jgi:hypothetical protein